MASRAEHGSENLLVLAELFDFHLINTSLHKSGVTCNAAEQKAVSEGSYRVLVRVKYRCSRHLRYEVL